MAESTQTSFNPTFQLGSDLNINRMGYGAMRITGDGIWGPPQDHDTAIQVLKNTIELGINFIDTADSYGPFVSEELIAEALHPYPKDLIIATKAGLTRSGPNEWHVNGHPDHLAEALEGSLKRLKAESIDLYQLHRFDPDVPSKDFLKFLQGKQEEGLIKHLGLSEVDVDQVKEARGYFEVVSVQNKYSIDSRKWKNVLQYCEAEGIAFIPWYPLNAGNMSTVEKMKPIAQKYSVTVHQLALSWLLHHSPNILLIPGTSSVDHLAENVKATDISLSEDDMQTLDSLA